MYLRVVKHKDPSLFGEAYERTARQLPVIGEQKDIRYYSSPAKSVLNGPETTGMGFWSINPSLYRLRIRMRLLLRPVHP